MYVCMYARVLCGLDIRISVRKFASSSDIPGSFLSPPCVCAVLSDERLKRKYFSQMSPFDHPPKRKNSVICAKDREDVAPDKRLQCKK